MSPHQSCDAHNPALDWSSDSLACDDSTANVVAQIHSLALLLDPQGLSAAVEELQRMQQGMEGTK